MSSSDSPSDQLGKNIVLCFDGTDNTFGPEPFSNVLKLYRMLETSDSKVQICYYQPGIGTSLQYDAEFGWSRYLSWRRLKMTVDSMVAYTLDYHMIKAYQYLMDHYEPGDRIIMFGFSRGAFIARLLAGMIERVGLLCQGLHDMVWMAWKIYAAWEYAAQPLQPTYETTLVEEFKKTFSRNIQLEVHFQGLFDSVNSCGLLFDRLFPYTARSGIVRHIRHAVSIDERRGKFKQQSFSRNPYKPDLFSLSYRNYVIDYELPIPNFESRYHSTDNEFINQTVNTRPGIDRSDSSIQNLISKINTYLENEHSLRSTNFVNQMVQGIFQVGSPIDKIPESNVSHDLVEKWFPGDHSDVGGSWPPDVTENNHFMSDTSLRWILAEAIKHKVLFKKGIIHDFAEKYSSVGSLLSASHDLLSFKRSSLTMKSPFEDGNSDKDGETWNSYRGFSQLFNFWSFWKFKRNTFLFRTFNFATEPTTLPESRQTRADVIVQSQTDRERWAKQDGYGHYTIFRVMCWWIAELIPIGIRIENENCEWKNVYIPNLGRRRNIPADGDLHWSVYWRIKYIKDYRPDNLPKYASDLIREYECIDLPDRKGKGKIVAKHILASPVASFPDLEGQHLITLEENNNNCQCNRNGIEDLKKKTEAEFQHWIRDDWETVPDDLAELLDRNPDL